MDLQHLLRGQRTGRLSGHQGPHSARVCAIGPATPAAHHRCYEGEPGAQHHLQELLERKREDLQRATIVHQAVPPAVVSCSEIRQTRLFAVGLRP